MAVPLNVSRDWLPMPQNSATLLGVVRRATAADRAALRTKIETLKPSFLAFTSKNAGKQFLGGAISLGAQLPIGGTKVFVLPSTSLAARWQWAETFEHWHDFAGEVARA